MRKMIPKVSRNLQKIKNILAQTRSPQSSASSLGVIRTCGKKMTERYGPCRVCYGYGQVVIAKQKVECGICSGDGNSGDVQHYLQRQKDAELEPWEDGQWKDQVNLRGLR